MFAGKQLFVTDLDGTLLRDNATISDYSVEILNKLISQGLLFTISTARSFQTASQILKRVNLRLPCIVFNGVFLIDPINGEVLLSNILNRHIVIKLLELGSKHGFSPFLFGREGGKERLLYTTPQNEGQQLFLNYRLRDERLQFVENIDLLEQNITLNFIARHKELLPFKESVEEKYGDLLKIYFAEDIYLSGFYTLEFYHREVNKGGMLSKLSKLLGLPLHQVTVFGDHVNDLEMFNVAGYRIAVSNAHKDILMKADKVITSNENDGVARYLNQLSSTFIRG